MTGEPYVVGCHLPELAKPEPTFTNVPFPHLDVGERYDWPALLVDLGNVLNARGVNYLRAADMSPQQVVAVTAAAEALHAALGVEAGGEQR